MRRERKESGTNDPRRQHLPHPTKEADRPSHETGEWAGRGNQAAQNALRRLGEGEPLDAATRARMESAFGTDLGHIRVHDDAAANAGAGRLGTRAFSVGEHVAFKAGEYQPGTPVGDVILSHELAHALQHREGDAGAGSDTPTGAFEADANRSVLGVMARLWTGGRMLLGETAASLRPRLHSGLALRRCSETQERQAQAAFEAVVGGVTTGPRQPIPIPMPNPDTARGMLDFQYAVLREDWYMWNADRSRSPRYTHTFGTNYIDWDAYRRHGGSFGEIWPHFIQDAWNNTIPRASAARGAGGRGAR